MDSQEVEFRADAEGVFPMTWGLLDFWRHKISHYGTENWHYFNLPMVVDLPGDIPGGQAAVAAALRRLVERNQSLRTHFLAGDDGPFQKVARAGSFTLRLEHSAPETSRARAEALAAELAATHFDNENEWGVRFALVSAGPGPRHLAFAVSHLVADGGGVKVLIDDFLDLLTAQADGSEPPARWQPAEQVGREQTERSARRTRAAVRYWRKHLERIPPSMFASPAMPAEQPRFHRRRLSSRALAVAATRLATDCEVSVPSTVLAGTGLAFSALCGQDTCSMVVVVGNRYDEDARSMLACTSQDGLLVVDFSEGTVADAVRATHRAATTAYFYGYYDPYAIDGLVDEIGARRGAPFDRAMIYNDLSALLDGTDGISLEGAAGALVPEADARKLLEETEIIADSTWDGQNVKIYMAVEPGTDLCRIHLVADTAYLPSHTMETLLRGIETIVLEAAYRNIAIADIPALTGLRPLRWHVA
jgi:hypothetical protein